MAEADNARRDGHLAISVLNRALRLFGQIWIRTTITSFLQCLQEINQILHLLRRESYLKALVIEIHHLGQTCRRSVVKIRCACSETTEDGTFDAANIRALSRDQCLTRGRRIESLPCFQTLHAHKLENRKRRLLQLFEARDDVGIRLVLQSSGKGSEWSPTFGAS
jgi:hypothetical protein